ncbi:cation-translocating P-type ATPase C-terminal domain-containing protein [Promicromonospora sp. MEB111]|uniref:cation-translocating P-type ATPase C-terminal domain-containing protein n=1 Tax=unclassified Promicromonospora TaxID=2647929 RepID=UPI00254EB730|nr:cation-translocating P-type ATPase C-terminal domain-containing protein [Promicromonospora sp. MEB111]
MHDQDGALFASLRSIGLFSNRLLLWGIGAEILFAAALVGLPPLQRVFGTVPPPAEYLALLVLFPVIVWGTDEAWRLHRRRRNLRDRDATATDHRHRRRRATSAGAV